MVQRIRLLRWKLTSRWGREELKELVTEIDSQNLVPNPFMILGNALELHEDQTRLQGVGCGKYGFVEGESSRIEVMEVPGDVVVVEELGPDGEDLLPQHANERNDVGHCLGLTETRDVEYNEAIHTFLFDSEGDKQLSHLGKEKEGASDLEIGKKDVPTGHFLGCSSRTPSRPSRLDL